MTGLDLLVVTLLVSGVGQAPPDPLEPVRQLYASADYESALAALETAVLGGCAGGGDRAPAVSGAVPDGARPHRGGRDRHRTGPRHRPFVSSRRTGPAAGAIGLCHGAVAGAAEGGARDLCGRQGRLRSARVTTPQRRGSFERSTCSACWSRPIRRSAICGPWRRGSWISVGRRPRRLRQLLASRSRRRRRRTHRWQQRPQRLRPPRHRQPQREVPATPPVVICRSRCRPGTRLPLERSSSPSFAAPSKSPSTSAGW